MHPLVRSLAALLSARLTQEQPHPNYLPTVSLNSSPNGGKRRRTEGRRTVSQLHRSNRRKLAALLVFAFAGFASAQTLTTVAASHISISGTPIGTGSVILTPVNNVGDAGTPIPFVTGGGGGLNAPKAFSCALTAGALSGCQVPDACATTPANILYTIDITSAGFSFRLPKVANICGATWALDAYAPGAVTTNSQAVQVTYGAAAAPDPCATPSFYYQNGVGLTVCVGGHPIPVGAGSISASTMAAAVSAQTGCTVAGNAWNPATNTCAPASGTTSLCPLHNATNICITDAPYNAVGNGTTDNTAAFAAAIAAIAALPGKTGTIWVPDTSSSYVLGTTLLDTGCANAVLPMPKIANYGANTLVNVSIKGFSLPSWNTSPSGGVLKSALTTNGGKLIGGCDSDAGGGFPNFTNVKLEMENITISLPANTGAVAIDASNLLAFQGRHLLVLASGTTAAPTTSGGIFMPQIGNEIQNELSDTDVAGFYTGYKLTEHTHAARIYVAFSSNCLVFDAGSTTHSTGSYTGNGVRIDYVHEQDCVNDIVSVAGAYKNVVSIGLADFENTTGNGVLDPSNNLYGILNLNITNAATSTTTACNANISGGSHITVHYLLCQPETSVVAGPPSGLIENWTSQDGSGTTFANTGTDSTNSMTTNAAWATATGFTGNVATYNGTSSFSVAASAANTNFDGSSPFSVCIWFNSNGIQSSAARVITTVDGTSSAVTGWDIFINPSGGTQFLNVLLFNNFTANNYVDFTGSANVTANVTHLGCFKYDGTKSATSVKAFLDGAPTTGTETSTLTGSIANGNPVMIGAALAGAGHGNFFHGAIGRARIFNRLLSDLEISTMFSAGPNAY